MVIGISSYKITENEGQGRINLEIIKALIKEGFKLAIFTTSLPKLQGDFIFDKPYIPKLPRLIQNYFFAFQANHFFKKIKPDIIIGNGYSLSLSHDINICHFVHGAYLKILPTLNFSKSIKKAYQYIYTLINSRIEKKVFSRADRIVAISQTLKQELIAIGVPPKKISVIRNMLSKDSVLKIDKKMKRKILFAGDFSNNRKNLQTVIEAMTMINGKLTVCGKGNTKDYKKIANKFGVSKKVIFKGFVTDLKKVLTENDILVLPSLYEGLPVVILEALANSIPVVISKKCGLTQKQLIGAGIILRNEKSPKEIANSCNKILDSYTTFSQNTKKFSINNNVCKMTKYYINLIKLLLKKE